MSIIREALQEAQNSDQIPFDELRREEENRSSNGVEFGLMPSLAEDIRALRENMELLSGQGQVKVIGVTSAAQGEGTSTIASFLAVSIGNGACSDSNKNRTGPTDAANENIHAEFEAFDAHIHQVRASEDYTGPTYKNVLLIDANLRGPALHAMLNLKSRPGLSDVLENKISWHKAIQNINNGALHVLTAGTPCVNPGDALSAPRMRRLLSELRDRFTKTVIDLPPVTSSIETLRIGQWVDGIVYVISSGQTRAEAAKETLTKLSTAHGRVLGVVLNRRQFFIPERIYGAL